MKQLSWYCPQCVLYLEIPLSAVFLVGLACQPCIGFPMFFNITHQTWVGRWLLIFHVRCWKDRKACSWVWVLSYAVFGPSHRGKLEMVTQNSIILKLVLSLKCKHTLWHIISRSHTLAFLGFKYLYCHTVLFNSCTGITAESFVS